MKLRTILLQEIREGFLVVPVLAVDQPVDFKNQQSSWAWWLSTWESCSRKLQCNEGSSTIIFIMCYIMITFIMPVCSNTDGCILWLCTKAPVPVKWFLHNEDRNFHNPIVQGGIKRAVVQSEEYAVVIASNHTVAGKFSGDIPAIPETSCDRILTVSEVPRVHQQWLTWK